MFLFLSKLLPIFFYPLGLACLLMVVALITFWKRPRIAVGAIATALFVLLIASNAAVSRYLVRSLEWQHIPRGELPQVAAIVVLGGGIKPKLPPRPWVDVSDRGDRILHGAQLYRQGKAPWLVLSGGRIDWKDNNESESKDMAAIALAMGVPQSAILEEPTSLNTYQNAVNVGKILDDKKMQRRVLLITSAMHMPRSLLIFKRQGIDAIAAPTDFLVTEKDFKPLDSWQAIIFNLLPDIENLDNTTSAIKEYVGIAIYRLKGWL
ncbi:YdcF family protein [Microseira sp. BLCC-F43]|jgi:uncharacterized SAM-binding protein YcdF (DUF218 family)|uniref:YdcF family protein n=1 Tax=Microseira sp. BLCC-F43 TaxID=3153602 RepID=UPI0035B83E61